MCIIQSNAFRIEFVCTLYIVHFKVIKQQLIERNENAREVNPFNFLILFAWLRMVESFGRRLKLEKEAIQTGSSTKTK